jgi:hypothetical protein
VNTAEKITLGTAIVVALSGALGLLFGTNIIPRLAGLHTHPPPVVSGNAPQSSIAGRTIVARQATKNSKFYIGTVTAGDGTDATYTRNAKEFLSNELGSARLEDPDNGERVDAVISNVGADDLPEPGGNFWRGHAKIAATLHPPTPSGQIELVPSSSDRVLGSDENDASLNALADAASKLVQKLKGYADNRFR